MPSQLLNQLKSDFKDSISPSNFGKFTDARPIENGTPQQPHPTTHTSQDSPMHISKHSTMSEGVIAIDCHIGHVARILDTAHVERSNIINDAVIYGNATVRDSRVTQVARIGDDAVVDHSGIYDTVQVRDNAQVDHSHLYHLSIVEGRAKVRGSKLRNHARVKGSAQVKDTEISEHSVVDGDASVEDCRLSGNTLITGSSQIRDCKLESVVLCHGVRLEGVKKSRVWYCGLQTRDGPSGSAKGYQDLSGKVFLKGKDDPKVLRHLQQDHVDPFVSAATPVRAGADAVDVGEGRPKATGVGEGPRLPDYTETANNEGSSSGIDGGRSGAPDGKHPPPGYESPDTEET